MYPVMVNRFGTVYPWGSNKEFSSRFCVNSQVQHETLEEGRRIYRPKSVYSYKNDVNSPNILSNDYYQASYQKFKQIIPIVDCNLGMVSKRFRKKRLVELESRGRIKIIHRTALLRSARILRRVQEIYGDLALRLPRKTTC